MVKGGLREEDEKRLLLAGKISGGAGGASGFGVFANGGAQQQMNSHPFSAGASTDHTNLITRSMGWKGGKGKKKSAKKGGSQLLNAAVPALLVLANNSYKRSGSRTRGKRSNRSRKTYRKRR
jgi:hypothetical protein